MAKAVIYSDEDVLAAQQMLRSKTARKGYRGTLAFQIFMGSFEKGVGKRKAVWLKWKA